MNLPSTSYPAADVLLEALLPELSAILDSKLVGLYLAGSLVTGDFDPEISDIDLLAAISTELTEHEFSALETMHYALIADHPIWQDRLEILYLSLRGLQTFKTERSPIAVISPGEPFNRKDAGRDWLMNWHMMREKGITLYGPPPKTIIAQTTTEDFIQVVKEHALSWGDWIEHIDTRHYQGYAILTLCRALYTVTHGEQLSKKRAANWVAQTFPEWKDTALNALNWRERSWEQNVDHAATLPETQRFVAFVANYVHAH